MNFLLFFFFRRRIFCVEKKKISLFQFIFFSVCWISISSVSAASSSHSLPRRPNKNTGGRRKCVFLEQKLVLFSTLFRSDTSLCLQQSHYRIIYWGVVLVNSVPNTQKISGIKFFFVKVLFFLENFLITRLDTWEKKSFEIHFFHFCYWAELESLHFVLHRLYFRNFPRNWRCKQMIFLVLAFSSILQHSVSTGHPWCVHVLSLLLSLHLSDNNQSKLWSTRVRLLQQHHEMQMSIRRPSRVDVQLPQR